MTKSERIWLDNLRDEREGIALYAGLAKLEPDDSRAKTFASLAEGEQRHAAVWLRKLEAAGVPVPPERPSARVRALLWLARRLGTNAVLGVVIATESRDAEKYALQGGDAAALAHDERDHGERIGALREPREARAKIAHRERWHSRRTGNLRAGVFGMNDGLVSNMALLFGVGAAGAEGRTLIVTGVAGTLAGAFSMAVGEYVSVASQRDLLRRQIELEAREIAEAPEEEQAELAELLEQKGLDARQAATMAAEIMKDPKSALDTMVREELGLDPAALGSPIGAALASFATFAVGALLPLAPYYFLEGPRAALVSGVIGAVTLSTVGILLGFLSGTSPIRSSLRMLLLAALATGITVVIGRLVGASLT